MLFVKLLSRVLASRCLVKLRTNSFFSLETKLDFNQALRVSLPVLGLPASVFSITGNLSISKHTFCISGDDLGLKSVFTKSTMALYVSSLSFLIAFTKSSILDTSTQ